MLGIVIHHAYILNTRGLHKLFPNPLVKGICLRIIFIAPFISAFNNMLTDELNKPLLICVRDGSEVFIFLKAKLTLADIPKIL